MVCVGRGDWAAWAEADGLCASNRIKRKELISSGAARGRHKIVLSVVVDNDKTIQFFTPGLGMGSHDLATFRLFFIMLSRNAPPGVDKSAELG